MVRFRSIIVRTTFLSRDVPAGETVWLDAGAMTTVSRSAPANPLLGTKLHDFIALELAAGGVDVAAAGAADESGDAGADERPLE
jgi:hypothetical protein